MDTTPACCKGREDKTREPTGTLVTLADVDAYLAQPPSGNSDHAIIMLTDTFGCTFRNNQLLADDFAKEVSGVG
ncbi:hypothetical protein BDK51DRAFT_47175 [Blyttiomyces helicus]|uniref:Uncharacterized protein n=1 Tax=Blyttiomyces helicus TaxID=388810 RepID=A0A4P9VXJ4_9FUNG|nr:hypothetical protein BDK51DRAFT_47175 [Blyttiomyces helicus]|eukprot:RKO82998.1 hypothetical protein BDK51DRAFT_47175 [Blyttiomyces helicus]